MGNSNEEQNIRIEKVLEKCKDKTVNKVTLAVFFSLLKQTLPLPCDVIGKEDLVRYTLCAIENSGDDMYGLLGSLQLAADEKKECIIPLCDLKAVNNRSLEFMLINDYATWFVNNQF
ncbi:hypothetical protein KJ966_25190 [bacterium]|nr:hypothetical protein [bacterium]